MAGYARSRFWNLEARGRGSLGGRQLSRPPQSVSRRRALHDGAANRVFSNSQAARSLSFSPLSVPSPPLSSLFSLPSYSLSFSPFMRLVAIPPFSRFGPPLRSSRCSLSVRCSSFLGPFILLGPPFRLSPFNRFSGASVRARSSRHESLHPRRTAYSYLAVLRRGSGYARRLRQRCRAVRSTKNSSATSRVAAVGWFGSDGRTNDRFDLFIALSVVGNYIDAVVVVVVYIYIYIYIYIYVFRCQSSRANVVATKRSRRSNSVMNEGTNTVIVT